MNTLKIITLASILALFTWASALAVSPKDLPAGFTTLEIGDSAPDFSLSGVDGRQYILADFGG